MIIEIKCWLKLIGYLLLLQILTIFNYRANDTIILLDTHDYNELNLESIQTIFSDSSIRRTIYISNSSSYEDWYFKCDSWGEVTIEYEDTIYRGGWNFPYKESDFIFARANNRSPVIPLFFDKNNVNKLKITLKHPIIRGFRANYGCEIMRSEAIGKLSSFQTIITIGLIIILIVFAIYNFFLFFITKDINFIKYSLTHLSFSLLWFNTIGVTVFFFHFDLIYLRLLDSVLAITYMSSYYWFTRGYLNTKLTDPKIDLLLKWYQYIIFSTVIIFSISSLFATTTYLDYILSNLIIYLYAPVGVVLLMFAIVRAIVKKNRLVFYFSFAMLGFVLTVIVMSLDVLNTSSNNIFVLNSVLFGAVIEAILFSLGLAAKIKISQEEKELTQAKLLGQYEENQKIKDKFSKELEGKVEERTIELKQKNELIELALLEKETLIKEVHHRVKNNLQLVYSFMSLQSNRAENEIVKNAISESKERVRTLTMIHNNLSFSENSEEINIRDYIPDIANHLSSLSLQKKLTPVLKIDSLLLPVRKAVSLGLIINEIITNSIKYAEVSQQEMHIYITALKNQESLSLIIYNDGINQYKANKDQNSLGLLIIEDLTKQLNAKLEVDNNFKYKIVIPIG